jgi:UDP-N-acetylmuramoyl-L-alanyl-D-glutamate--2,6-diaminopimelate ligase
MKYSRYHGLGNDYLVMQAADLPRGSLSPQEVVTICHRNFGVGSDGIVLVEDERADGIVVRVLNPDGSEAENSGNGMRIVSRYLFDTGRVGKTPFTLLVRGERKIQGLIRDPQHAIQVDMGKASFVSTEVPVIGPAREVVQEELEVLGQDLKITCVNVGNPHCVIFNYSDLKGGAQHLGPVIETHEYFPRRINVQFAQVIDRNNIRIEIWERGAGYTLASGSSSCAAASAARRLGLVDSKVTVHMPGGSLTIEIGNDFELRLTGPVTKIADGSIDPEVFSRASRSEGLYAEGTHVMLRDLILREVCRDLKALELSGSLIVSGITSDSRQVKSGDLFFAIAGAKVDARAFINDAFDKGAVAVVSDVDGAAGTYKGPVIQATDVRRALSYAAHVFFGKPSHITTNIAITGTSGKTSVAWILSHALHFAGVRTFLGGTLGFQLLREGENPASSLKELGNTTIDPISVHRFLVDAVRDGAQASVFEATSQGVVQRRMRDVAWDVAVFTNLTRDHLDLHGTMEAYEAAKSELFTSDLVSSPKKNRVAILNCDDAAGERFAAALRAWHPEIRIITLSQRARPGIDFVLRDLDATDQGLTFVLQSAHERIPLVSRFVGTHNAYNIACAALVMFALGHSPEAISDIISKVPVVPGRLEPVSDLSPRVYVDYAHKPDALEKVLKFLKPICRGRLINVFGCGGDRDTGKRPVMGEISYRLADLTVLTSDNPRTEDPETIVKQVAAGIQYPHADRLVIEVDRRRAIMKAIQMAKPEDLIVIAGKGHEPYQEIHGVKHPFHDVQVAREALATRG